MTTTTFTGVEDTSVTGVVNTEYVSDFGDRKIVTKTTRSPVKQYGPSKRTVTTEYDRFGDRTTTIRMEEQPQEFEVSTSTHIEEVAAPKVVSRTTYTNQFGEDTVYVRETEDPAYSTTTTRTVSETPLSPSRTYVTKTVRSPSQVSNVLPRDDEDDRDIVTTKEDFGYKRVYTTVTASPNKNDRRKTVITSTVYEDETPSHTRTEIVDPKEFVTTTTTTRVETSPVRYR